MQFSNAKKKKGEVKQMVTQSKRKDTINVGLSKEEKAIISKHANTLVRSMSETIRLIVIDYIERNRLKEKYSVK